jgi:hypothetical protein
MALSVTACCYGTIIEVNKTGIFENESLSGLFGSARDGTERVGKFYNEELHDLYFS